MFRGRKKRASKITSLQHRGFSSCWPAKYISHASSTRSYKVSRQTQNAMRQENEEDAKKIRVLFLYNVRPRFSPRGRFIKLFFFPYPHIAFSSAPLEKEIRRKVAFRCQGNGNPMPKKRAFAFFFCFFRPIEITIIIFASGD